MLELILAALAAVVIDVVVTVAILAFVSVVQWFLDLQENMDENDLAFTIKQELKSGNYTVYQGVFDKSTDKIKKARRINTNKLDTRLAEAHADDNLVVYT